MTETEFKKLTPGKTLLKTVIDGKETTVLFKFFLCDPNNFDGYWLLVTTDLSNPSPSEIVEGDIETYDNLCEVVEF